jgi:hypothetical protein
VTSDDPTYGSESQGSAERAQEVIGVQELGVSPTSEDSGELGGAVTSEALAGQVMGVTWHLEMT